MIDIPIRVQTQQSEKESADWSLDAQKDRKWNMKGKIFNRSNSHGLIYQVRHDDGSTGWYEPRELILIAE